MKTCKKCNQQKENLDFHKHKASKDGLSPKCKECCREIDYIYNRTKNGLITRIYGHQKQHSKEREHNLPTYSKQELKEWLYAQPKFHLLYDNWKRLDYQKDYIPSVDRKDDYIGYTISNIQIMTWKENRDKAHRDRVDGINNKYNKAVLQIDKNTTKVLSEFYSVTQASRETLVSQGHISSCCIGSRKLAGGFMWKFA